MMSINDPIPRRKLSDHIQERLLAIIQNGKMKPGDTFPSERELMETYSVGRPAIREAMQNLQRMGLVSIRHGERPKITNPSFEQIAGQIGETMLHLLTHSSTSLDHLKEVRIVFEMEMVRIAAKKRTPEDISRLKEILSHQRKAGRNSAEFLKQDANFHLEIAKISGNPLFEGLSRSLFDWLTHFHIDLVHKPGLEQLTLKEHQQIIDAVEAGDSKVSAKNIWRHLTRANELYHQDNLQTKK